MGKQSKRRKGAKKANKGQQKQKGQDRPTTEGAERQRSLSGSDGEDNSGTDEIQPLGQELQVGCRVWYDRNHFLHPPGAIPNEKPRYRRGILKRFDPNRSVWWVLPVEAPDRQDRQIPFAATSMVKDTFDWTLRFAFGDCVLIYSPRENDDNEDDSLQWLPAIVTQTWPTPPYTPKDISEPVACYECKVEWPYRQEDEAEDDLGTFVPVDADQCIKQRQALRFSAGTRVLINSERKVGTNKNTQTLPWIQGTILEANCVGRSDFYAAYRCAFQEPNKPKLQGCWILHDNDEHLASVDATPRQRLFDSIAQDCSYEHIDHIVSAFRLDVGSFQDLLIAKAIDGGSYHALAWLQRNTSINLVTISDDSGNGLLHQIAKGPNSDRFFECASDPLRMDEPRDWKIAFQSSEGDGLVGQRNHQGRSWLHELVISGKTRSLSLVFSPKRILISELALLISELAWKPGLPSTKSVFLTWTEDNNGVNIRDTAEVLGDHVMTKIIDEFVDWYSLFQLVYVLTRGSDKSIHVGQALSLFGEEPRSSVASRLIRFLFQCRRNPWLGFIPDLNCTLEKLVCGGQVSLLSWLIDAVPSLLKLVLIPTTTTANRQEFVQPELYDVLPDDAREQLTLVSVAAHGKSAYIHFTDTNRNSYGWALDRFLDVDSPTEEQLETFMEVESERSSEEYPFHYKLRLLSDDKSLTNRLASLQYLVREKNQSAPNTLDVIRWRQCGVLRWLVDEFLIDIRLIAVNEPQLVQRKKDVTFLGTGANIPATMTVGEYLCFAAIEFDDLQSIKWLVSIQGIAIATITCNGWNVLHACAYFGRTEIAHWLLTECPMRSLLQETCKRKPWDDLFAAQLAVNRGFVRLAEVLLSSGCPSHDLTGKSIDWHAKQSPHDFAKKWGKQKEKPLVLENDIRRLYRLLQSADRNDTEAVKRHISKSKCLDYRTWRDCNYWDATEPGPCGKIYADVFHESMIADGDYIVWLCRQVSPSVDQEFYSFNQFWGRGIGEQKVKAMNQKELREFAQTNGYNFLVRCLDNVWTKGICCEDPLSKNPALNACTLKYRDDPSISRQLSQFLNTFLREDVLNKTLGAANTELQRLVARGSGIDEINDILQIFQQVAKELHIDEKDRDDGYWYLFTPAGQLNLESDLHCDYADRNPLKRQIRWRYAAPYQLASVYMALAIEGYADLIRWTLDVKWDLWDEQKEIDAIRIAAYLGHSEVVDIFLGKEDRRHFASPDSERYYSAILGAAEAGNTADVDAHYDDLVDLGLNLPSDQIGSIRLRDFENYEEKNAAMSSSLVFTAVFGSLNNSSYFQVTESQTGHIKNKQDYEVLKWVARTENTSVVAFAWALELALSWSYDIQAYERCLDVFSFLVSEMGLNVWLFREDVHRISEQYLEYCDRTRAPKHPDHESAKDVTVRWFKLLSMLGLEIQSLNLRRQCHDADYLRTLQSEQFRLWSKFDVLKKGFSLDDIQRAVSDGTLDLTSRDNGGLLLIHLAASYDRLDVLQWLVDEKMDSLETLDGFGRSVLQVAKASNAMASSQWIERRESAELVSKFIASHVRRRAAQRRKQLVLRLVQTMQACHRGRAVRQAHQGRLISRLEESRRFQAIWGRSVSVVSAGRPLLEGHCCSWVAIKKTEHDIMRAADVIDEAGTLDGAISDIAETLENATIQVLDDRATLAEESESDYDQPSGDTGTEMHVSSGSESPPIECDHIKLTSSVMKWLRQADSKYRQFFVRRMKQLAAGDRSRILAKRLTGTTVTIYESYLEQKSGHRILWTESEDQGLLIRYVAKHKEVSRLMRLIEDAENRSNRQLTVVSELPEMEQNREDTAHAEHILLDPLGDTPMKLFQVDSHEIHKLGDSTWKPRLFLTARERNIVETEGTVLLLGRSGTGKTVCILGRMGYDLRLADHDSSFSQLFVARSRRLRDYVKEVMDDGPGDFNGLPPIKFAIFQELIQSLESIFPESVESDLFLRSRRMGFRRFKREVYQSRSDVDALIVWTSIRSFIKGSIEAVQNDRHLSETEYLGLGKRRCRLSPEHRLSVYKTYKRYEEFKAASHLWDDCDRIASLLRRMKRSQSEDPFHYREACYSKIYVDEVQDYTQAEIALFFYLCGPRDLFLAGDPAQSVVEGVEFRFEELRSVGHHLYGHHDNKRLIPDKPKTVNVNFRSHSGILAVAAGVLDCLFGAFPDAAKQLKKDRGLFHGPRPAVFQTVAVLKLRELVAKLDGVVVLTHDKDVSNMKRVLDYPLVYGIREAKGLEFHAVLLVDFFCGLPSNLQRHVRDLLLGRDHHDISSGFPEIECYLKLLYTGVTRCIQRLFFAETSKSIAGDAFVRWITTTKGTSGTSTLAVKSNVNDVEAMVRTPDEWRSAGLDNAVMAEASSAEEDPEEAVGWLDKAIFCFDQVNDTELARRARTHRSSARFRSELERMTRTSGANFDDTEIELEAAQIVEKLLVEQLFLELERVFDVVLPLLEASTQRLLQERLISKLPLASEECL